MSTILKVVILGFGLLVSVFIVWKKLREDYGDNEIFSLNLGIIGGGALSFIAASFFPPVVGDLRFWMAAGGSFVAGSLLSKKLSMRPFEVLEAIIPAVFFYLLIHSLVFISLPFWRQFIYPGVLFFSLLVFLYISTRFRRFFWYPSGKLGLASLFSLIIFFWSRAILANIAPDVLPWSNRVMDTSFGTAGGILAAVVIYIRSGRSIRRRKQ